MSVPVAPPVHLHDPDECGHEWQPVSFALETQMLDEHGRYIVTPQPDLDKGRVYLVCLLCACHTYMETQWRGYRLEGSLDRERKYQPDSNRRYVDWPTP